jgi:hypothetical protein
MSESWSVERVKQWICGLGNSYTQYAQNIEDNQIDGRALIHGLTSADNWADIGITNVVHRTVLANKRSDILSAQPAVSIQSFAESSAIDISEIRLVRRLGVGNFGEAWLASFRGADVVIKRLKADTSPDDEKVPLAPVAYSARAILRLLAGIREGSHHSIRGVSASAPDRLYGRYTAG